MTVIPEYAAPPGLDLSKIKEALTGQFHFSTAPRRRLRCSYFDTFDWRLYAHGAALEIAVKDEELSATWIPLRGGEPLGPFGLDRRPCRAEDIASSALRRRLLPVVSPRALLLQFNLLRDLQTLGLMNRDRKTVAHIQLVREKVSDTKRRKPLPSTAYFKIVPLQGYASSGEQAVRALSEAIELEEIEDDIVSRTLARLDRAPVDPSRLWVDLDHGMRTDVALKRVLLHLLDTLEVNEQGARTDIDPEFLHDFRVALRRSRSALTQVKGVFSAEILTRFTPALKWLGGITGPTRDLDVYLLNFDQYKKNLPHFQQEHLEPLRQFLRAHQKMEQEKIATALGSSRYRNLKRNWRAFLNSTDVENNASKNASRPILEVVSARIFQVYDSAIKEGKAIGPETPAEALHDLRKTCKKLRYLMEIFQVLYPRNKIKHMTRALKALQENLGDFQDLDVQADALRMFGQQMMDEDHVGVDTVFAMGTLIAGLNKRQRKTRRKFSTCFSEFACARNRALFKDVFSVHSHQPTPGG